MQSVSPWRLVALVLAAWSLSTAGRFRGDLGDLMPAPVALAFAIGAAALASAACWRAPAPKVDGTDRPLAFGAALAACVLAAWASPRPELAVAAGAVALALAAGAAGRRWATAVTLWASGVVVVSAVAGAADRLALARFELPVLAETVGVGLGLLGADAGAADGAALHWTVRAARSVPASVNSTGLAVQASIAAILTGMAVASGVRPRNLAAIVLLALPAALAVRFAAVATVGAVADGFVKYENVDYAIGAFMDWRLGAAIDLLAAAAFLPAVLAAARSRGTPPPRASTALVPAFGVLVGLVLSFDSLADAASTDRPLRVAIDEGHSRWEPSDLALGEDVFGQETGYNFRALTDWLGARHGPVRRLYDALDRRSLADVDVLILKTPTEDLALSEVDALVRFVEGGGGLILIGDHTNVFGTSDVLAPVARRFGFEYEFDCLFDQRQRFEQVFRPGPLQRLHPILADVPLVRFEVGCSIRVLEPWRVQPVAVGRGLKSQPIDYAPSNFYPATEDSSDMAYGQFANVVTSRAGLGRVVGLADSTFLSTFSVCLPGRRELVEGMVDWVGRRDRIGSDLRPPFQLGLLLALTLWLWAARRGVLPLAVATVAAAGSSAAAEALALGVQSTGRPAAEASEVYFLEPSTDEVLWPVTNMVRAEVTSFNMFFQWVLRTGSFPRLVASIDDIDRPNAPVVWIAPPEVDEDELARLDEHVRAGGTLIALEVGVNPALEKLAALAGLTLRPADDSKQIAAVDTPHGRVDLGGSLTGWRQVEGGEPLLRARSDVNDALWPVAAVAPLGDGAVVIVSCGELFNDLGLGLRYDVYPDANRRRLYQFEFDLMRAAAGMRVRDVTSLAYGPQLRRIP